MHVYNIDLELVNITKYHAVHQLRIPLTANHFRITTFSHNVIKKGKSFLTFGVSFPHWMQKIKSFSSLKPNKGSVAVGVWKHSPAKMD